MIRIPDQHIRPIQTLASILDSIPRPLSKIFPRKFGNKIFPRKSQTFSLGENLKAPSQLQHNTTPISLFLSLPIPNFYSLSLEMGRYLVTGDIRLGVYGPHRQ